MATPTTTTAAIREALESQVVAISRKPRFERHRNETPLLAWAEQNPSGCLRRFSLLNIGSHDLGPIVGGVVIEVETQLQLIAAYPEQWGRYGSENRQSMQGDIETDAEAIRLAIGLQGHGNYPAGSWPVSDDWSEEQGQGVTFLYLTATLRYYRSST